MSTFPKAAIPISLIALVATISTPARAQTPCFANPGPDIICGDIHGTSSYAVTDGIAAFSIPSYNCNIGREDLPEQTATNKHPVLAQDMYRYDVVGGVTRIQQIGMSWIFHYFVPLTDNLCCPCNGHSGSVLGSGCAEPVTSSTAGIQLTTVGGLGPRFDINPHSGFFHFPYPFRNNNGAVAVTSITRRLQVHVDDLDPALNPGAQYFVEALLTTPDDAAARNQNNNASHRQVSVTHIGANYSITLFGPSSTRREYPAIHAWQLLDANVFETPIDTPEVEDPPGSGNTTARLILAARATSLPNNTWHYEYALYNMNSDRAVSAFSLPIPTSAHVSNPGFHDVDYHSGDGFNSTPDNQINFDGTDWPASIAPTNVTWTMPPATPIENSNALRWGTTYNFRFDADTPPALGLVTLTLFKPVPGRPDTIQAITTVPAIPCVPGDFNNDGMVTAADIPLFVDQLLPALPAIPCPADLNHDGRINGADIPLFCAALKP